MSKKNLFGFLSDKNKAENNANDNQDTYEANEPYSPNDKAKKHWDTKDEPVENNIQQGAVVGKQINDDVNTKIENPNEVTNTDNSEPDWDSLAADATHDDDYDEEDEYYYDQPNKPVTENSEPTSQNNPEPLENDDVEYEYDDDDDTDIDDEDDVEYEYDDADDDTDIDNDDVEYDDGDYEVADEDYDYQPDVEDDSDVADDDDDNYEETAIPTQADYDMEQSALNSDDDSALTIRSQDERQAALGKNFLQQRYQVEVDQDHTDYNNLVNPSDNQVPEVRFKITNRNQSDHQVNDLTYQQLNAVLKLLEDAKLN